MIRNNSFFDNYRRPLEGNLLAVDYNPYLRFEENTIDRNGDLAFLKTRPDSAVFWSSRGVHSSALGSGSALLNQTAWQTQFSSSPRHDSLLSFYGIPNITLTNSSFA